MFSVAVQFRENFNLIDTWMLLKRYKEEMVETPKEMLRYLKILKEQKNSLVTEVKTLQKT